MDIIRIVITENILEETVMNIALGENIKGVRRDRDLTQQRLTEELEVSFAGSFS